MMPQPNASDLAPWPASPHRRLSATHSPTASSSTLAATTIARRQIDRLAIGAITPARADGRADRDKPTVIALREIAAGKVGIEMLAQDRADAAARG